MKSNILFLSFILVVASTIVISCAPISNNLPAAPQVPVAVLTPTVAQPTAVLSPSPSSTTATSPTITTTVTTQSTSPSSSSSPTRTNTPAASSAAPGVYATAIRVFPPIPPSGPDSPIFYVTFVNTTGKPMTYKWIVKIWSPDNATQSFGETAAVTSEIPPGTTEIASAQNWHTNPIACTPFYARVYSINLLQSPDPMEFRKPDGSPGPLTNFQVCPATPKP